MHNRCRYAGLIDHAHFECLSSQLGAIQFLSCTRRIIRLCRGVHAHVSRLHTRPLSLTFLNCTKQKPFDSPSSSRCKLISSIGPIPVTITRKSSSVIATNNLFRKIQQPKNNRNKQYICIDSCVPGCRPPMYILVGPAASAACIAAMRFFSLCVACTMIV